LEERTAWWLNSMSAETQQHHTREKIVKLERKKVLRKIFLPQKPPYWTEFARLEEESTQKNKVLARHTVQMMHILVLYYSKTKFYFH